MLHVQVVCLEALHKGFRCVSVGNMANTGMANTVRQLSADDAAFLLDILHHLEAPIAVRDTCLVREAPVIWY